MRLSPPEVWVIAPHVIDRAEFTTADLDRIDSGEKAVYDIAIIAARTDQNRDNCTQWQSLDASANYIGAPGSSGVYAHPQDIPDEYVRYYATDMWAWAFGFELGDLIRYAGLTLAVVAHHLVDSQNDGAIGYHDGWLICAYMNGRPELVGVRVESARRGPLMLTSGRHSNAAEPMSHTEFVAAVFDGPDFNGIEDE